MTSVRIRNLGKEHPAFKEWALNQANPSETYPAVQPHWSGPKGGDNSAKYTKAWWDYLHHPKINSAKAAKAFERNGAGLFNYAHNKKAGKTVTVGAIAEGITSAGNVHDIQGEKNGSYELVTMKYSDGPPDPNVVNPKTFPKLFVRFTALDKDGNISNAPDGYVAYFPLVAKDKAYVPKDRCEVTDKTMFYEDVHKKEVVSLPEVIETVKTEIVIDISKWQGEVDFEKMYAAGVRIVKLRATIGNYYIDTRVVEYAKAARKAGLKVGLYHVVRPDNTAQSQVDLAMHVVELIGFKPDIPWTVDTEVRLNNEGEPFTKAEISQRTYQCCTMFETRDGRKPELYSNYSYVMENFGDQKWPLDYPLHHSYYFRNSDGTVSDKWKTTDKVPDNRIPEPYYSAWKRGEIKQPYLLWQCTDKEAGEPWGTSSNSLDLNKPWPGLDYYKYYFPGWTVAQWVEYLRKLFRWNA